MTSLRDLKSRLLENPEVRAEYERQRSGAALATKLIAARAEANMTQQEVAEAMRTTQSVVARLESGNAKPTWPSLQRYADAIDMDLELTLRPRVPRRGKRRARPAKAAEARAAT